MNTTVKSLRSSAPVRTDFFRRAVLNRLSRLEHGRLEMVDPVGTTTVGDGELNACVRVADLSFYKRIATGGSVAAAESYMAGEWRCDDLTSLVRIFARNQDLLDGMEGGLATLANYALRIPHWFNRNSITGSRKNIAAHYDLGNEFFKIFLDPHQMYSSATFLDDNQSLEEASAEKLDRICRKLRLSPEDRLVEIGSGWGGFACFAASRYGCNVVTTTISQEQYNASLERVQRAGLSDRVTVLLQDYRDLRGTFDKLVSIEMIEAVGHQYLDRYFTTCSQLLAPDGLALIQAITIEDRRYKQALKSVDFIKRYIFPGSFIPCVSAMVDSAGNNTDLRLVNLEDQGNSYALTIAAWRARFESNLARVRALGYSEEFVRMWRFYLAYCEGGFRERTISSAQLLFAKPNNRSDQWLVQ